MVEVCLVRCCRPATGVVGLSSCGCESKAGERDEGLSGSLLTPAKGMSGCLPALFSLFSFFDAP